MTQQEWIEELMARAHIPRPCRNQQEWEDRILAVMEGEGAQIRMGWLEKLMTDKQRFEELLDAIPSRTGEGVIHGIKATLFTDDEVLVAKPKICTLCHTEIRGGYCQCV